MNTTWAVYAVRVIASAWASTAVPTLINRRSDGTATWPSSIAPSDVPVASHHQPVSRRGAVKTESEQVADTVHVRVEYPEPGPLRRRPIFAEDSVNRPTTRPAHM